MFVLRCLDFDQFNITFKIFVVAGNLRFFGKLIEIESDSCKMTTAFCSCNLCFTVVPLPSSFLPDNIIKFCFRQWLDYDSVSDLRDQGEDQVNTNNSNPF